MNFERPNGKVGIILAISNEIVLLIYTDTKMASVTFSQVYKGLMNEFLY